MNYRTLLFSVSIFLTLPLTVTSQSVDVLARVGSRTVTAEELVKRIELMPWPAKEQVALHDTLKRLALESLIAEKLLAQEAADKGIGDDPRTSAMIRALERALARDQLYVDVSRFKTPIPQREITTGTGRYGTNVRVIGFIFAEEQQARAFYRMTQSTISADSAMAIGRKRAIQTTDSVTVKFGELFPAFEDAIYGQPTDGFTVPAFSPDEGWAVFRVFRTERNPEITGQSRTAMDAAITKKIRVRLEMLRAKEFASRFFRGVNMSIDSTVFRRLADTVVALVRQDSSGRPHRIVDDIDYLRWCFRNELSAPFAFRHTRQWTLEEILESLRFFQGELPARKSKPLIVFLLNRMILQAVESEALSEEAMRRGLQNRRQVRDDIAVWENAWRGSFDARNVVRSASGPQDPLRSEDSLAVDAARERAILRKHLNELARHYGVEITAGGLKNITLMEFSMVTKRFLGFGGTMLALPALVPQTGWMTDIRNQEVVAP
jgi:hypothetical protein